MSKQRIIDAALKVASKRGYMNVTRNALAKRLRCANGLVNYYCRDMGRLRSDIIREAIATGNGFVIGQAVANRHPLAVDAISTSLDLRNRAIEALFNY